MAKIDCFLEGEPPTKTKQQRKHRVIVPKDGGKPYAMTYKAPGVAEAEDSLRAKFLPHRPGMPLEGPITATVTWYFTHPKSHTKKQRETPYKLTSPDLDNAEKMLFDAIAGLAFVDDKQIWRKITEKRYCGPGERPGIWIILEED